ncbi:hypothetical protein KVR01_004951 [Diaporthe batatas]|uniref:uncharacterized protein n=1 Tax=Diaporthe batatas TaxID=748121 RepID=UPI001D051389|nr:uncharacterized protein KVR01_004951 [Diaporthe batatas]KAG8164676.1 hypothetical protein KVR01_004951 [Diaporthe batatas]
MLMTAVASAAAKEPMLKREALRALWLLSAQVLHSYRFCVAMVGVPGRSKACLTCRKRKKGCDYQRPECTQCMKAGIQCGGYERERIFVHSTASSQRAVVEARETNPAARKLDSPPSRGGQPSSLALTHRRHSKDEATEITLSGSLSRTASEEKYISLFWDSFLPKSRDRSASREWARSSQHLFRTEPALRSAVLAVSLGMLGERENCRWMKENGLKAYGRALLEETVALRSPSRVKSDAVLLATKFMTTYEMLFGARTGNLLELAHRWRSHNLGSLAIMETRTPLSAIEGHGHHIFLDSRLFWIIDGLKRRKRTPLSRDDWKTIPWSKHPKSTKDLLLDILVEIPGVLEDIDNCEGLESHERKREEYRRLVAVSLGLHTELESWYDAMPPERRYAGAHGLGTGDEQVIEELPEMYTMLLYWATCLYLYSAMRVHSDRRPASVPPFLPYAATDLGQYIGNMSLVLPFFFDPDAGKSNLLLAAFPLGTALQFKLLLKGQARAGDSLPEEDTGRLMLLFTRPEFKPVMGFLNSLQRDNAIRGEDPASTFEGRAKQWAGYKPLERG